MSVSLPSLPVVSVDLPEPKLRAEFVYNFFTSDESINENSKTFEINGSKQTIDAIEALHAGNISRVPRFVKLFISHPEMDASIDGTKYKELFLGATDSIMDENDFSSSVFVGVGLQDSTLDQKLNALVNGALAPLIEKANTPPTKKTESLGITDGSSLFSIATALNAATSDDVDNHFIVDSVVSDGQKNTLFESIKKARIPIKINSRYIGTLLNNVKNDPITIYGDELAASLPRLFSIQSDAASAAEALSSTINELQYDSLIQYITIKQKDASFVHNKRLVGFVIKKIDVGNNATKDDIIAPSPSVSVTFDPNVRYGSTYSYDARAIYIVKFEAVDVNSINDASETLIYAIEALVSSRPSALVTVSCTESVPPAPPADFGIIWDQRLDRPRLIWNMPVHSQRDIKKFQVFRRRTLREAYELIKQFDFDDNVVKAFNVENIVQSLSERSSGPVLTFVDREFDSSNRAGFIYSVCAVDAHGMLSGYSQQLHASIDGLTNRLVTKSVSRSGAPKPLPNYFVDDLPYVQAARFSGATRMIVSFDPDLLSVYSPAADPLMLQSMQSQLTEEKLVLTEKDGAKYLFQLLNIDAQRLVQVITTINDKRFS